MKLAMLIIKAWTVITTLMLCLFGMVVSFAGFERGIAMMDATGFLLIWFSVFLFAVSIAMAGLIIKISIPFFGVAK